MRHFAATFLRTAGLAAIDLARRLDPYPAMVAATRDELRAAMAGTMPALSPAQLRVLAALTFRRMERN